MTKPDAYFVFPNRTLYHGPDITEGEFLPAREGFVRGVGQFSKRLALGKYELFVCQRMQFWVVRK